MRPSKAYENMIGTRQGLVEKSLPSPNHRKTIKSYLGEIKGSNETGETPKCNHIIFPKKF